jgi:hypothetical protein
MVTASPEAAAAAAATSSKGASLPNAAMTASPVGGKGYRLLQPTKKDLQCLPDIWDFMVKQCPDQTAVSSYIRVRVCLPHCSLKFTLPLLPARTLSSRT